MGYNRQKLEMKKIFLFNTLLVLCVSINLNTYSYRFAPINPKDSLTSYINSDFHQSGDRLPNISATFGRKGIWTFRFYQNGTFSQHKYTADAYGRLKEDLGSVNGTYYIIKTEYGGRRVCLRFANGKEDHGYLKYENNRAVFTYKDIRNEEIE